jgi:predicted nuclease of predicted toxin-antitoxin system
MNTSFLVDVNLPKYFSFFNDPNYTFVSDINLQMSDTEIWDYALINKLVVLTKDTDFYNRFLVSSTAPKIIYFQLGTHVTQKDNKN